MNPRDSSSNELRQLASALCDGEISRDQAQRLESLATQSPEALEHLLEYLELHAELAWMLGTVAKPVVSRPEDAVVGAPRPKFAAWWTGIATTVAVVLVVGLIVTVAILTGPAPHRPGSAEPIVVANLTRSIDAEWSDDTAPESEVADLTAGQLLRLESGLVEIDFQSGASVILDGRYRAVEFKLTSTKSGILQFGRLTAAVPPQASGFTIDTPSATITDLGTEIGVVVERRGTSEVHVFEGKVEVRPGGPSGPLPAQEVSADHAVRVALAGGVAEQVQEIPLGTENFLWRGRAGKLRGLVKSDPRLIHHYTFEGLGRKHKCADSRGSLDLVEVEMHGGGGGLDIYASAPGLDSSTSALHPFRSRQDGDQVGVGLQSQADAFRPPPELTVELLLVLETSTAPTDAMVASAVAFPADPPGAGALGVAADRGRLVFRPGQSVPEGADPALLEPDHWYYVAAIFKAGEGQTTVDGYLADLTQGDGQLVQVAQDLVLEGAPAHGRLGIGKGFDRNGGDVYPWAGRLDEIAIYGAVLDRQTLEQHLAVLVNKP
jgi:ferric-dicitrate binding protein FerR (iron transport regulator)